MRTWTTRLLMAGILVLFASPVWGEYYQYTDRNGVLRYTDNIAAVPADQRPEVKIYESVNSSPIQKTGRTGVTARAGASESPADRDAQVATGRWADRLNRQTKEAEALNRIQTDLSQTFMFLQNEKAALAAKASAAASGDYQKQVDALNAKIARYESQLSDFRKKEKAFNTQYK